MPVALLHSLELPDEAATQALAAQLAALARAGDVIALMGELGAGKTTFARAFIRARGATRGEVPSPTFTLVEVYEPPAGPPIWHFDLYRLRAGEEAIELGLEEALATAISLIEWPERLGPFLPDHRLEVRLAEGTTAEARRAELAAGPGWRERLGAGRP